MIYKAPKSELTESRRSIDLLIGTCRSQVVSDHLRRLLLFSDGFRLVQLPLCQQEMFLQKFAMCCFFSKRYCVNFYSTEICEYAKTLDGLIKNSVTLQQLTKIKYGL